MRTPYQRSNRQLEATNSTRCATLDRATSLSAPQLSSESEGFTVRHSHRKQFIRALRGRATSLLTRQKDRADQSLARWACFSQEAGNQRSPEGGSNTGHEAAAREWTRPLTTCLIQKSLSQISVATEWTRPLTTCLALETKDHDRGFIGRSLSVPPLYAARMSARHIYRKLAHRPRNLFL